MASFAWLQIYRSFTSEELEAEITSLRTQLADANGITAAGSGSKNYARDLAHLEGRLAAACQVRTEKGNSQLGPRLNGGWAIPDFSGVRG